MVDVRLTYDKGLDRYYGLLELAEKYELIKKVGTRYDVDGAKLYGKEIMKNPNKYFTPEFMEKLNDACEKEFRYGQSDESE